MLSSYSEIFLQKSDLPCVPLPLLVRLLRQVEKILIQKCIRKARKDLLFRKWDFLKRAGFFWVPGATSGFHGAERGMKMLVALSFIVDRIQG
jgi:hypothetical protein